MAEALRIEIPIVAVDKTGSVLSKAQEKVTRFEKVIRKMDKSLRDLRKEKYQLHLEAEERVTPVLKQIGTGVRDITGKEWSITMKAVDMASRPIRSVISQARETLEGSMSLVEIQWDEIIGEPFRNWWETEGKRSITEAAGEIENGLGNAGAGGGLALFGIDKQKAAVEGKSTAGAFWEGILEWIGKDALKNGIKKALESVIKGLFPDALGEGSFPDFLIPALIGNASQGTGLLGFGAMQAINMGAGNLKGGASLGAGSLSVLGIGAMAGAVVGTAGMISAVHDLKEAAQYTYDKEQREKETRTGLTKMGMVGAGAAAGAALGSLVWVIGPLAGAGIGAGLGGLGALLLGEDAGNLIGDLYGARDRQQQALIDMADDLQSAMEGYREIVGRNEYASDLIRQYEELEAAMHAEGLTSDEAVLIQEQMRKVAEKLQGLFPGLISNYDLLNGKTGDRIDMLKNEMDLMDEQAERQLRQSVQDTKENLPVLKESLSDMDVRLADAHSDWETKIRYRQGLFGYLQEFYETRDRDGVSQEEVDAAAEQLLQQANALSEELGQGNYFNHIVGIAVEVEALKEETQGLLDEIDGLNAKKKEQEEALSSYYEGSVQLTAANHGMDVSSLLESIDESNAMNEALRELLETGRLTEETEESLDASLPGFSGHSGDVAMQMRMLRDGIQDINDVCGDAIAEIQEMNKELEELPEEKRIHIVTVNMSDLPETFYGSGPGRWSRPEQLSGKADQKAEGGFVNGAQLSWIGEDGPEAVIPLGRKRRARGLSLWKQTGKLLGIGRYAEGAILGADLRMGGTHQKPPMVIWDMGTEEQDALEMVKVPEDPGKQVSMKIEISPNFQIEVEQGNAVEAVRAKMYELTDDICANMANKLAAVFSNTPQEA